MRILFVIDTWGLIGGTERHAAVVVPALIERGHDVRVLCREDHAPGFADVDVVTMPELSDGAGMYRPARRLLARMLRESPPDVVFQSALRNQDAIETLLDAAPVVRYVHDHTLFCPGLNKYREDQDTCHEPMGFPCLRNYWLGPGCVGFKPAGHVNRLLDPIREMQVKWRARELARRATHTLTNSRYMESQLLQAGFFPDRTSVLYYFTMSGTDFQPTGPLPPATEDFLASTEGPLIFTPARLTLPDKGVDFLLTSLVTVKPPFRAVIAGTGGQGDWLRQKAVEIGLGDRVHFSGWTDSGGIETLYERADLIVCPSVWDEPFGLVGIEAMAHAKPVIAFRVGGIPEWLSNGETGVSLERKDTLGMTQAIQRLLDDPAEARRLGEGGRRLMAERFPRERHIDQLEATLAAAAGIA